ncbi:MAG: C10 family peptidase, partial [Muribaculaceae bacterium]|nr:C10 family peptidase [Muribaculaceae bacterium]
AAMQKAQNFMQGINPQAQLQAPATPRRAMGNQSQKPYYIFNAENNQGFVIVSGDDRSEEILGFSDKGYLDVDNLPSGLLYMLDTFEEDLQKLDEQGYTNTVDTQVASNSRRKAMSVPREPIAPLVKTYWTQSSPFVDMMTEEVVGCQRIASAQLLYYWGCDKTLATITGVPTSIQESGKYEPQTFDMTKIRAHYRSGATDEEKAEVARYISCVRYSLGTGTQSDMVNPNKGPKFWGITPGAILHRQDCFPDDFERIVYEEVKNGAPVFVGGHCKSATPNHYFLVDGYSHDDFFHINWGWAGICDGYFRLSPLNAYNWSTVANWSQTFEALIGFRGPGLVAESTAQPNDVASLGMLTFSFTNSSSSIPVIYDDQFVNRSGTLRIRTLLENWSNNFKSTETRTFDLELAAYDMNNNKVKTLATQQSRTLGQAQKDTVCWNLTNIDLPDGEYYLVSKSKDATYSGDYHFDYVKGVYSHAKLVVNGNQLTASLVPAFVINSTEIIGKKKPGYRTAIKFNCTNNSFNKLAWNFSLYKNQVNSAVGYTQDTDEFRLQAKSTGDFVMEFEADEEPCTLILYNEDRAARGLAGPIYAEIPCDPSSFPESTATNSNLTFKWSLNN